MRADFDLRVQRVQLFLRRLQFRPPDIRRRVQNLPLQVAEIDDVEVDQAEGADAGGGEVHRDRGSESTGADAEHFRGLQLPLTVDADLRHDEMPRVALHFVVGERGRFALGKGVRPLFGDRGGRKGVVPLFRTGAARHRRDDAHGVVRRDGRLLLLQIPDVLVVHVYVDEAAQSALLVVEMRFQASVLPRQIREQLADGRAARVDRVLLIRVRPERCRDEDFRHDAECPLRSSIDRL